MGVPKTHAAISFVAGSGALAASGASGATTTAVNTTGATLLVVGVHVVATTSTVVISDTYHNTWNLLGWYTSIGWLRTSAMWRSYLCLNPTVA